MLMLPVTAFNVVLDKVASLTVAIAKPEACEIGTALNIL
jgi:hypothetical protein